jgi:ATP-dependent exoDNAse (exonuclease V) alpha subunit
MHAPALKTITQESLTPEFEQAFDLLEHSRTNVFLTGKAGTGKSTFLQYFRTHTQKNVAVVAPTGVAALNVSGQTIHSFFRLKPSFVNPEEIKPIRHPLLKKLDVLIIDEISMVRADVFDGINKSLQLARRNSTPFGGVQVCIIGDLFQLPPVVANHEKEFFAQYYDSPFFFATESFEAGEFQTVLFNTIHRQQDETFIHVLNSIRSGECDGETFATLNARVNPKVVPAEGTLVLTATNALAEQINSTRLATLTTRARCYEGVLNGNFGLQGERLPAPEALTLKVGAQVMFVKNDPDGGWVNGTIGIVEHLGEDIIRVRVGEVTHEVEQEKWKTIGYEFSEEQERIVEKTLGSYTQFPLTLAWAITIHKSQGKTLERVIIDLGTGAFAAGQLYVALSRCRTLSGIALKQPITSNDVRCDAAVVAFMQGLG